MNRLVASGIALCFAAAVSASADDNVRAVQRKLKEAGFYQGAVDGAYSSSFSAALTRYQIRSGLPITGQLDRDTSRALGAEPAVTRPSERSAATGSGPASDTWRQLRKKDEGFLKNLNAHGKARAGLTNTRAAQAPAAPPAEGPTVAKAKRIPLEREQSGARASDEQLRDYIAAFVLAGLDPQVGAEADFFGDQVYYYDDGLKDRSKILQDLRRYDARWPERRFWLAGDLIVDPVMGDMLRVSFPIRFELRNGQKHASGKVLKTLVLKPVGDDFQIVGLNERKVH